MSQARTPTKPKRSVAETPSQTPTGPRGAKAARNAKDGDKDDSDVRRDMRGELELEPAEGDSSGAVAEHEADGKTLVPELLPTPSPAAASRARLAVFWSEGRVGRVGSDKIRIAYVELMTRGEPNANPSPSLYMSGYGLADLFESFAKTAAQDSLEKLMSLRTIWNGACCDDRVRFTLTKYDAAGMFEYCCHPDDADKHTMRDNIFPLWSWVGFRGARRKKNEATSAHDTITDTASEVSRIVRWFQNTEKNTNAFACEFGRLSVEQESWNVFVREKNALRGGRDPKKAVALASMACFDLD